MVKPTRNSETPRIQLMIQDTGMRAKSVLRIPWRVKSRFCPRRSNALGISRFTAYNDPNNKGTDRCTAPSAAPLHNRPLHLQSFSRQIKSYFSTRQISLYLKWLFAFCFPI